jgi:hypothetical protein
MTTPEERRQQLRDLINERQQGIFQTRITNTRRERRATYNADGTVTRSGGTAERPRGRLANSGQPSGSRVATAEGQVLGQARADNSDVASQVRILQQDLATAIGTIPMQVGTGDPNTASVLARYDADIFYDTDGGTFWRWFSDSESDPAEPEWVVVNQLLQGFSGVPAATVYIDGALAVNDSGTAYTGTISGGWSELSGGGGSIQVSQATFGSATVTRSDDLIYQAVSIPFDQLNCFTATQQDIVLPSNGIYELTTRCIITNNRNDPPISPPLFPNLRARGYLQSDDSQVLFYEMVREFQQVFDTSSAPSHILTNEFVFEVTEPVYFQLDGDDIVSPLFGPTITATIKKMS